MSVLLYYVVFICLYLCRLFLYLIIFCIDALLYILFLWNTLWLKDRFNISLLLLAIIFLLLIDR